MSIFKTISLFACIFFLQSCNAHASEETIAREPVAGTQIKLMGKGFAGRKSHEVISLACVGENQDCETLRFVHFVSPSEVYYIGPKFKADLKKLKKAMKKLDNKVRNRAERTLISVFVMTGSVMSYAVVSGILWPVAAWLGLFAVLGTGDISLIHVFDIVYPIQNSIAGKTTTQVMNQDGWNWAIKPRAISEKTFQKILSQLQSPDGFFEYNAERITPVE